MNNTKNILPFLPKHLFWDFDIERISIDRDKSIIIPRLIFSSTESTFDADIAILEKFYSQDEIIQTLRSTKERISNRVCLFVANKYAIEPFKRFKNLNDAISI
jgi:hypothetical protein